MSMKIWCQVYRADSYEPDGRPGQVGLDLIASFILLILLPAFSVTCLQLLVRFEWPNGDEYTGQYINGKRNGLGDMQVLEVVLEVLFSYVDFRVWNSDPT